MCVTEAAVTLPWKRAPGAGEGRQGEASAPSVGVPCGTVAAVELLGSYRHVLLRDRDARYLH
jgi:hypothetical protein